MVFQLLHLTSRLEYLNKVVSILRVRFSKKRQDWIFKSETPKIDFPSRSLASRCVTATEESTSDSFGFKTPILDFLKETHPTIVKMSVTRYPAVSIGIWYAECVTLSRIQCEEHTVMLCNKLMNNTFPKYYNFTNVTNSGEIIYLGFYNPRRPKHTIAV